MTRVFISSLLLGFCFSAIATWLLFKLSKLSSIGHDDSNGVQKLHINPTSRLGGVAIIFGLASSMLTLYGLTYHGLAPMADDYSILISEFSKYSLWFLLSALPVWMAGLIEDLTHRVGPTWRLVMALLSATCLFMSLDVSIKRTDVWPIDLFLSMPGASFCVTLLVVAGFTHSVNIVDGFHGLASGLVIIALATLAIMAWKVGDGLVLHLSLTSMAVVFGFFMFNWPKGLIFLGDSGAYLIGFWVVELGILLASRNPQISPMAPVMAGLLPLIETIFSMYRRHFLRGHSVNCPDALHLHTLVYRRLLFNSANKRPKQINELNSRVALFFWLPASLLSFISCAFMHSTLTQLALMLGYFFSYIVLYVKLIRFKTPKFMKFRH